MNAEVGDEVDHQNHNTLDCRKVNLLLTKRSGNAKNTLLRRDNKSGVCGVTWHKRTKKWVAKIMVDGKSKHLGYFITLGAATFARKAANCQYGFHINHGQPKEKQCSTSKEGGQS